MNGKFASINISVYKLHKNLNLSPIFCYNFIIKPHYKKTQKNTGGEGSDSAKQKSTSVWNFAAGFLLRVLRICIIIVDNS